ncbi:hypothetical protein BU15DRAFT_77812 [Melanogaster broomeanus]|nr:hypothetical protein BU15DRAFT_77812 [Melanogaster broomeanus]
MDSTLLEHPHSPTFMDAHFAYDSLSNHEPYLQYPQPPHGASTMTSPPSWTLPSLMTLTLQPRLLPSMSSVSPQHLYHGFACLVSISPS